jgi:hypothetical protein
MDRAPGGPLGLGQTLAAADGERKRVPSHDGATFAKNLEQFIAKKVRDSEVNEM